MGFNLDNVYVEIRGSISKLKEDLRQARSEAQAVARQPVMIPVQAGTAGVERETRDISEKLGHHFQSQLLRGLGVMEGIRFGAAALTGAMKQIHEQDLIDPNKGQEALQHILNIRDASRTAIREIPFIGGALEQTMAAVEGDQNIRLRQQKMQEISGGTSAEANARGQLFRAQNQALAGAGVPREVIAAREAEQERRELTNQMMEERRLSAESSYSAMEARQHAKELGTQTTAASIFGINKARWNATEIEGEQATATAADTQAAAHARAASEIQQRIALLPAIASPQIMAGPGEIQGKLPAGRAEALTQGDKLDMTNALLAQILQNQQQNPPGVTVK
jgi:hypothetical protein